MNPSGRQYELRAGRYAAVVTEVGATLRTLEYRDRPLVRAFDASELQPVWSGAVLAPWPNRIADGRYDFAGRTCQLPINEPERTTAIHGLVAWMPWTARPVSAASVQLECALWPTPGYPWRLQFIAEYRLDAEDGLHLTIGARNLSDGPAPYGVSVHPYVQAPSGRVDDWTLQLAAESVVDVDPERLLPRGSTSPVSDYEDFRKPRRIGPARIDHAYTDLDPSAPREARVTDDAGLGVAVRWDAESRWVQVHTADRPEPQLNRTGLALEPMTCPADAFNGWTGLLVLEPGGSHRASWGIVAIE